MPACEFVITGPHDAAKGDSVVIRVPDLEHPCRATFKINGQEVNDLGDFQGLRVTGKSASHLSLITGTEGDFNIVVTVKCGNVCGPTSKTWHLGVGTLLPRRRPWYKRFWRGVKAAFRWLWHHLHFRIHFR